MLLYLNLLLPRMWRGRKRACICCYSYLLSFYVQAGTCRANIDKLIFILRGTLKIGSNPSVEGPQILFWEFNKMQVNQKEKDGVIICYIIGEINIDTVSQLEKTFKKIINNKSRKVLLNFSSVDYIDSLGMSTLIGFLKNLKNIQGVVFLSDLSPKIRSLFTITKCEKIFKIYDAEENALKGFCGY